MSGSRVFRGISKRVVKVAPQDPLRQKLVRIYPSNRVLTSALYRSVYSRDGSYFEYKPQAIVRLGQIEDALALIDFSRNEGIPITFRAGGTSLSGQTVGEGIIGELRTGFRGISVHGGGDLVSFEPGVTVNQVNAKLSPFGRKIGPDPASKSAAMMGGVLSNNSSGMQAGVIQNSYHTLVSLEFVLYNGHRYDTSKAADRERFGRDEPKIVNGLLRIRDAIRSDIELRDRIKRKYRIKNVTGYSLNSFLDFDDPCDIFSHLLIGAEGTLGFIAKATLSTLPIEPYRASRLLFFASDQDAARAVGDLAVINPAAVELLDYASLTSVVGRVGVPAVVETIPTGSAALLFDLAASSSEALELLIEGAQRVVDELALVADTPFSTSAKERAQLWSVRDGIFASVGGERAPGTTVILEDVAVEPIHLGELVSSLNALFDRYGYAGVIFGHAKAGNVHFLVCDDMSDQSRVLHFSTFMDEVIDLVVGLEGSLKAEHGTGRAVAPFVEKEWGSKAYGYLKEIKTLCDPYGLLNPGVIINDNPNVHLEKIKAIKIIGDNTIDKCIECGYCEHVCPTRYVTLTPRQRIVAHRSHLSLLADDEIDEAEQMWREYEYAGRDSCVADGMCATVCPMGINTADLVDHDRSMAKTKTSQFVAKLAAERFSLIETATRGALVVNKRITKVVGNRSLEKLNTHFAS
ncbi:FAD-binding and (Fe-S)-binding domain-containing protein [Acidithrix sp. C25]|uniref:FAD-binding and (Fe-S)-binding domain-containing protein n=1 Tax=Acidithrix sp. C25 TaxID=1671482 RepID=UPI00191BA6F0|nr:FAD-binding and (Fe-S)-binding domain-containing protein [Acidithrix sp. C25]CAG4928431.1 unnamed protein product [Acidithrix sp. C25]